MNPVTDPSIVNVPNGDGKLWNGMSHVIVLLIGAALADVSWFVSVGPPGGVNVNVVSNAVGTKTDVLPSTCAGVNSPLPFTTTVKGAEPGQTASIWVEFFAL